MISKDLSLLYVEDDETMRHIMAEFFRLLEFRTVYVAVDGQDGLEQFRRYNPDMVITDYRMPKMNGLGLSRLIKEEAPEVPIILITSKFHKELTEDAIDIGIDAYLFKPVALDKLHNVLEKLTARVLQRRSFLNQHKLLEEYKKCDGYECCNSENGFRQSHNICEWLFLSNDRISKSRTYR
ncbi:MAG: response regulator [Campylobacterales bacterium]|nr:response regulator [Campylobacterales bacterium]